MQTGILHFNNGFYLDNKWITTDEFQTLETCEKRKRHIVLKKLRKGKEWIFKMISE